MPIPKNNFTNILYSHYSAEVQNRGGSFQLDEDVKDNIRAISDFMTRVDGKKSLCLMGLYGNGKTTLLKALKDVMNTYLPDCGVIRREDGIRVEYATNIAKWFKEENEDRIDQLYRCSKLCIDDFGREAKEVMSYGNVVTPVADLLEHRYNEQMFTIISTNLSLDEIGQKYGGRIADRFKEMFEIVLFKNSSYRK